MRLHIGDVGPIPGVQAFGCTPTLNVERRGEYDSDERILNKDIPEFAGNVEVLSSERDDFIRAIVGKDPGALVNFSIGNTGEAPIMLNVWNKRKTRFVKSALVIRPTWTSAPYETSLDNITTQRCEYQAVNFAQFENHAVGFYSYDEASTGPYPLYNPGGGQTRQPVKLDRAFGGHYVACVFEKVEDPNNVGDYDFNYLCVNTSTVNNFTLLYAPTVGSTIVAYFAYVSTAEAGGYICQTL